MFSSLIVSAIVGLCAVLLLEAFVRGGRTLGGRVLAVVVALSISLTIGVAVSTYGSELALFLFGTGVGVRAKAYFASAKGK